jgi:hypothetical protein
MHPKARPVDLSIVIVAYNCREVLQPLLVSIFEHTKASIFEAIVVDNASSDGSWEMVKQLFPRVRLIENTENRHFRAANNQGIRASRGRCILLLNPDTLVLHDGTFEKMIEYMDTHPSIGMLGPKLLDSDGMTQLSCDRLPGIWFALFHYLYLHIMWPNNPVMRRHRYMGWDRADTRQVDSVSGACMLIRREALEQIGLLDEACLMYWEEYDLAYRIREAGWQTVHYADVEIIHHWTRGGTKTTPPEKLQAMLEHSMLRYYERYHSGPKYALVAVLARLRQSLRRLLK